MLKKILWTSFLLSVSSMAKADDREQTCRQLRGQIVAEFTNENCESPVNMCTSGVVYDSFLRGTSFYTVSAIAATPDDPDMQRGFSYVGDLVISTVAGDLNISSLGILDTTNGHLSDFSRNLSGTGRFQDVMGDVFFYGQSTENGFRSEMRGQLCWGNSVPVPR